MTQIFLTLIEHPMLFGFLVLCFMGVLAMTYEFLLRLFKRKGMCNETCGFRYPDDTEDDPPPPEPANVPKPPTDPDDVLEGAAEIEGAEEVEDKNGDTTVEYIYGSSQRLDGVQGLDWVQRHSDMKKNNKEKE